MAKKTSSKRGTSDGHMVFRDLSPAEQGEGLTPKTKKMYDKERKPMTVKQAEKKAVKIYEKTKAGQVRKY